MLERLSRTKRNIALAILAILVLWFTWSIRSVVNPLLIGYLAAYILHPFVVRVEQLGLSRRSAVNLVFVSGFVVASVISLVVVLQIRGLALEVVAGIRAEPAVEAPEEPGEGGAAPTQDATPPDAADAAPDEVTRPLKERLQERVNDFLGSVNESLGTSLEYKVPEFEVIKQLGKEFLKDHSGDAAGAGLQAAQKSWGFLSSFIGGIIAVGGMFLLVPLYAYYLLFELGRLHTFVRRYLPKRDRERLTGVADQIGVVVASFFRGRLAVCFVKGLILSIGLWIAGVDYAFLFGMLSGFLSLIPFFGPFIGFVAAFTIGILDHSVVGSLIRCGIVFGVAEVLEGYVLVPKILGDSLGLHPLVVIFAMLAGAAALGMFGILIALPLTASLVILFRELVLPALQKWADEEGPPGVEGG